MTQAPLKRFPFLVNTDTVFQALFHEVRYRKKHYVNVNGYAAALDNPIFDFVADTYAQEMHYEGITRLFTYDLQSIEDLIQAWTHLCDFRALYFQDRTILVRESLVCDTYYGVASINSTHTEILTPWGSISAPFSKGTFNAIWDSFHLLQPPPPSPNPPDFDDGILLDDLQGHYTHITEPEWID